MTEYRLSTGRGTAIVVSEQAREHVARHDGRITAREGNR